MSLGWMPWNVAVEAGAVVGATGAVARASGQRRLAKIAPFTIELSIVLVLYALWRVVGTISLLKVDGAKDAGVHIWDLERALHLPNEQGLQHLFLKSSPLIQACNVFYATVHIPSMGIFLVWLWFRHRDRYPSIRNTVALTTLWCLAIQLIPVAPPRLIPQLHVADTPALFGQAVYPAFGKSGPAQLSAMPSVHVAWAAIIGTTIFVAASRPWRWFGIAHPVVTMVVVVVTGNHYWLDGVVGVAIAALAFASDRQMRLFFSRRRRAPRPEASRVLVE
ncbi:MAG TPA: phosphatase PAP2 family protein [Acidimicrobiia bacterium]|nr:phosphatase PAP2 family protein [Acidimicrobiia bacterium]